MACSNQEIMESIKATSVHPLCTLSASVLLIEDTLSLLSTLLLSIGPGLWDCRTATITLILGNFPSYWCSVSMACRSYWESCAIKGRSFAVELSYPGGWSLFYFLSGFKNKLHMITVFTLLDPSSSLTSKNNKIIWSSNQKKCYETVELSFLWCPCNRPSPDARKHMLSCAVIWL